MPLYFEMINCNAIIAFRQFCRKIINSSKNKVLHSNAILPCNIALEVREKMDDIGNVGISTSIVLISLLLVSAASSSIIMEIPDDLAGESKQILDGVIDEITTYLKIEDVIGKYYTTNGIRSVEKIVILVKQLIQSTINMSEVMIKICNNNDVILLGYNGYAAESNSGAVFEHQIWAMIDNNFGLIVILDNDRSLLDYGTMNQDKAFIAIKLPNNFAIEDGKSISISIIPTKGITSSIVLETPSFHSSDVISFGKV